MPQSGKLFEKCGRMIEKSDVYKYVKQQGIFLKKAMMKK